MAMITIESGKVIMAKNYVFELGRTIKSYWSVAWTFPVFSVMMEYDETWFMKRPAC